MSKLITFLILMSVLLASACSPVNENDRETPMAEKDYAKSSLTRETALNITQEQIEALSNDNTAFALSFYHQIRQQDGNLIFSPLSLSLALSMALAGAETTTQEAMMNSLRFSVPEDEIYPTLNALLLSIEQSETAPNKELEGSEFKLNIANSLWGQAGYEFKQDFLDILAKNFGAGMYVVNFQANPDAARQAINDWVEQETEEKIKDLIPPGAINTLTRLVLANAIYFNAAWQYPFSESGTETAPFTQLDSSEINVDMMRLSGEYLRYNQEPDFQVVELPYLSNDFSMMILVPDQGVFDQVERSLTTENLIDVMTKLTAQRVNLRLPKFDYELTINANDPLAALGMSEAFQPDTADFSGITEAEKLFISEVLHKATITVDEEGTEAAAATAVVVGTTSLPTDEPINLTIDRPFIYFIQHNPTGTLLFMGRVTSP